MYQLNTRERMGLAGVAESSKLLCAQIALSILFYSIAMFVLA